MLKIGSIILAAGALQAMGLEFPHTRAEFAALDNNSMETLFQRFKARFERTYSSAEEEHARFEVFREKVHSFFEWNEKAGATFTKGITQFTDMDADMRRSFVMQDTVAAKVGPFNCFVYFK